MQDSTATVIIFTRTLRLLLYQVRDVAKNQGQEVKDLSKKSLAAAFGLVLVVAVPLVYGSYNDIYNYWISTKATPIANAWAAANDWNITQIQVRSGVPPIVALGQPPQVNADVLREKLDEASMTDVDRKVELIVGGEKDFPTKS